MNNRYSNGFFLREILFFAFFFLSISCRTTTLGDVSHIRKSSFDFQRNTSLWQLAKEAGKSRPIPATNPQSEGTWGGISAPLGGGLAPSLNTQKLKISLWGPPERLTLSINKTDVYDRRRYQEPVLTLKQIKDIFLADDAPERLPNYYQSNHAYDSPCPKPVGQAIIGSDDFIGIDSPTATTSYSTGATKVQMANGNKSGIITYIPMMSRNLIAIEAEFNNTEEPVWLRLFRHRDTIEYGKAYTAYGSPDQQVRRGYNYEKDSNNGSIDPPQSGTDGEFFWISQKLPAEKTFPQGFEYVMVGTVVTHEVAIETVDNERDLGTKPYLSPEHLKLIAEDDDITNKLPSYTLIRKATGSAATVQVKGKQKDEYKFNAYITVVTTSDSSNPLESAKKRLVEAKKAGFNSLQNENEAYFKDLYEKREKGRIYSENEEFLDKQLAQIFHSWTDQHHQRTAPDPTLYEADAYFGYHEQDWAPWHGLSCYNELYFTSAQVRNQSDRMSFYYKLVPQWLPAARANAKEVFGLPGALIQHGYLPPVKPDTYAHTHSTWEFCMEIPAQVLKVLWDRFDYGGDKTFLAETAYPAMRELAIFYSHYAELSEDGYYHVIPTMSAEHWGWTAQFAKNRDSASALSMFKWLLQTTADASEIVGRDEELRKPWRKIAANMAPYPTYETPEGPVFTDVRDVDPIGVSYNFFAGYTPTTLADEINLDSDPELIAKMLRTARLVKGWNRDMVFKLLGEKKGLEPEQLLNSRSGRIHLFPAVPDDAVVAFREFQARGGFLVSAQYNQGTIDHITVTARRTLTCRLMNPWPGSRARVVRADTGAAVKVSLDTVNGECLTFPTEAGAHYRVLPVLPAGDRS